MADKKISELDAAAALDGTEELPVVQDAATVKTTTQDIADLAGGGDVVLVAPTGVWCGLRNSADTTHWFIYDAGGIDCISGGGFNMQNVVGGGPAWMMNGNSVAATITISATNGVTITYVPAVTGDWAGADPTTIHAALDRIAALLGTAAVTTTKP